MPGRGLIVGVALLIVLGGLVFWSDRVKSAETAKDGAVDTTKQVVKIKDEDVRKIELNRQGESATVLERSQSGTWSMVAPEPLRVDQDAATSLLAAFSGLTADRIVEEKAADLSAFGLTAPAATVKLTTKDGKPLELRIGDETPTSGGVFAKLESDPRVFTIYTGTRDSLVKSAQDLRDKRLLTLATDKLTRVQLTSKGSTFELGRDGNRDWQIVRPQPMRADNGQVEDVVRKLSEAKMDTSVSQEEAQKAASAFGFSSRIGSATLNTGTDSQQIEIRKSARDNTYYARSSAIGGVHKVSEELGKSFEAGLESFRNKKLFDFGFNEPDRVEVFDGTKRLTFRKSGENWTADGKNMDIVGVQSLIDKLRELTATGFATSGFTAPALELVASSNGGKRVEKVQIARTANGFVAQRENEPAIYLLDPKAVEEIQRASVDVKPAQAKPAAPAAAK